MHRIVENGLCFVITQFFATPNDGKRPGRGFHRAICSHIPQEADGQPIFMRDKTAEIFR